MTGVAQLVVAAACRGARAWTVYDLRSHPHRRCQMKRARGFTLIEIAVVLFVVALVAGAIAQYLSGQISAAKLGITQTREAAIKAALINFISRNNRVPCPAIITLPSGAAGDGVEAGPQGVCTGNILSAGVASGEVPWVSLGLASDAAIDGYNNRFTYQITVAASALNAQTVMGMKGAISVHSAGPGALASASATVAPGDQLNDCRSDMTVAYTSVTNPCAAVAVLVSHGADGYGAYTDGGAQIAFPASVTGADARANADGDSKFVMKAFSGVSANPFDDVVLALTPNDLIGGLTNAGNMQSAQASINANFGLIKSALVSYGIQNRTGNFACVVGSCPGTVSCPDTPGPHGSNASCETTTFTYTLPAADVVSGVNVVPAVLALPATVRTDPWNALIQYTLTTSPISSATAAATVAFILTSAGPDGAFGTPDDISATVYVGELRTQFSKF